MQLSFVLFLKFLLQMQKKLWKFTYANMSRISHFTHILDFLLQMVHVDDFHFWSQLF
jgi:hypothetical protein